MASGYIGEIRLFAGTFAPQGWMTCDGQLMAISGNEALFQLIGTTYGGDGVNTFALPNLAARVPIHQGGNGTSSYTLSQNGGATSVTLGTNQIPAHTHAVVSDALAATTASPANAYPAATTPNTTYTVPNSSANPDAPISRNLNAATLPSQGGSQPHDNTQPYLAITYIISLYGIFPSQT